MSCRSESLIPGEVYEKWHLRVSLLLSSVGFHRLLEPFGGRSARTMAVTEGVSPERAPDNVTNVPAVMRWRAP